MFNKLQPTASVYVVFKNRVLLHFHNKIGLIVPLGGEVEVNETPAETAIKEVYEESGLKVKLFNKDKKLKIRDSRLIVPPVHILLHKFQNRWYYLDFIYFASARTNRITKQTPESKFIRWYSEQELNNLPTDNVRAFAKEALKSFC